MDVEVTGARAARHSSDTNEHYSPAEVLDPARETLEGFDLDPASCAEANKTVRATRYYDVLDDGLTLPWGSREKPSRVFLNPPGGLIDEDGRVVLVKTKHREGCSVTGACGLPPGPKHKHKGVVASAKAWWFKLMLEFSQGHVLSAVYLGFSLDILQSTQVDPSLDLAGLELPLPLDFPFCVPSRRLAFLSQNDEGVFVAQRDNTHASAIVLVPDQSNVVRQTKRFAGLFSSLGKVKP